MRSRASRAAAYQWARLVLRLSDEADDLEAALAYLRDHYAESARDRLEREAVYLRRHGASVPSEAILLAAEDIGEDQARDDDRRLRRSRRLGG
jgi:hypothetical protein